MGLTDPAEVMNLFIKMIKLHLIRNYDRLPQLLADIDINVDNSGDVLIIFNFCYFLQSKTFSDSLNIEKLGELLYSANYLRGQNMRGVSGSGR